MSTTTTASNLFEI
ncbi:unnamed protein product, partial [Rotaria sp. Silwood2]